MSNFILRCITGVILYSSVFSLSQFVQAEPTKASGKQDVAIEIVDRIEGQQAQPKLLFIIPWQEQEDLELKLTRGQLIDRRFLTPVEREGYQQETQLIQKLR